jgi:crossover junction endodeoxyribonuclease RuvC
MRVLGIDPGLATTGFGIIRTDGQDAYECLQYGVIITEAGVPDSDRLQTLFTGITDLIHQHQPDSCAVEKLFFQKNVKTALSVGQARGVVLLTLSQAGLPVNEYTPNEVKQSVCGYGNAAKSQVQRMVQTLLHLDELPKPDDAADALAVAICHIHHQSFNEIIQRSGMS